MQDSFVLQDGTVIPKKKGKVGWTGLVFAIIPLIGFICFSLVPIALSAYMSFTNMTSYAEMGSEQFVWFKNFFDVFTDGKFWHSLGVAFYATVGQFVSLSLALGMSLLLTTKVKGWNMFSVLYFIPYLTSSVATSMIWNRMFATDNGIINELFTLFGYTGEKIEWLGTTQDYSRKIYMLVFIFIQAWHAPGYGIIMFNAAFTSVDHSLYEAARIDGANRAKQFAHVTMPSISPTVHFLAMLGVINGLQQFEMFQTFVGMGSWTGGFGPGDMALVPLLYIYTEGISSNRMGYASAMSWVMFFIVFASSKLLNEKLSRAWVANEYE